MLITAAATPYEEQHRQRVRKYLTIMSFRIPALILAAECWPRPGGWASLADLDAEAAALLDAERSRELAAA